MGSGAIGPVRNVWRSIEVEVARLRKCQTTSHGRWSRGVIWPGKAWSIIRITVSRCTELKVTDLHREIHICEESSPWRDVCSIGSAVFGTEIEGCRCTVHWIGIREAVGCARDHLARS